MHETDHIPFVEMIVEQDMQGTDTQHLETIDLSSCLPNFWTSSGPSSSLISATVTTVHSQSHSFSILWDVRRLTLHGSAAGAAKDVGAEG